MINKLICMILGHKEMRVLTQVRQVIKGNDNVMITKKPSKGSIIYDGDRELYFTHKCSRCYQVIK